MEPVKGMEAAAVTTLAGTHSWLFLIIPALGGLVSGLLVYLIAPEAEGHGTDAMIDAFHRRGGYIRKRVPLVKILASAITIGSGGSAGKEGPIAQIGAGFRLFSGHDFKAQTPGPAHFGVGRRGRRHRGHLPCTPGGGSLRPGGALPGDGV